MLKPYLYTGIILLALLNITAPANAGLLVDNTPASLPHEMRTSLAPGANVPWFRQGLTMMALGVVASALLILPLWQRERKLRFEKKRLQKALGERDRRLKSHHRIIRRQAARLRKIDGMKNRFFTNITHEFRTPLSLIIGPVEQAIIEQPPPRVFERRMQGVLKNANHILNLINQLLDLAKIENGQMKLDLVKGDLVAHTAEVVKRFQTQAQQKQQRLIFLSSEKELNTSFDQDKWDKILYNLIANALYHTPREGCIQVYLGRSSQENQKCLSLEIKDSGSGMPPEELNHIFKRFYQAQAQSSARREGTGIGLALVYELVKLQLGEIQVHSHPGQGTSFSISMPEMEQDAPVAPLVETDFSPNSPPASAAENTTVAAGPDAPPFYLDILIVEDQEDMREYIRQCLKLPGYHFHEATNGQEGLETALSIIPDLIIADVMMPKMDGIALTQKIRKDLSTSHIPVVLLTARASLNHKLDGLFAGADAYLSKPFSPRELLLRVQKLIELRQGLHRYYHQAKGHGKKELVKREDEFILRLRAYILENITEPGLNGNVIGQHFALSRVHLYRKLKALTGQSISQFVKRTRLQRAYELLEEGRYNVNEIGYQCGFTSDSHFSRCFKSHFGHSPSKIKQGIKYS